MDIGKSLTYITEDERWVTKLLIAVGMTLLSVFILPMFILNGYVVAIARNVRNGAKRPLPEWEDWGGFLRDGLNLMVAIFVYSLPLIIINCFAAIPIIGLGSIEDISDEIAAAGIFATFGIFGCLTLLLVLATIFIFPAVTVQYVRHNQLGACFRIGEVFGIVRENMVDIVTIAAVLFVATMLLTGIANIPCIGWILSFFIGPYLSFVSGHFSGQLAAKIDGDGNNSLSKEDFYAL